jgi:HK97 family phage portal protein
VILENGTNMPLAPQAFAETSPQFWPSYFVPRLGMTLETAFASYGTLYRTQPWVYAGVRKVAGSIARLGAAVWDQSPETGQELDLDGPYAQLIANPCPTMSPSNFWFWTAATIEVYGETYWIKLREGRGRQITGFVPMHPSLLQIFRDTGGEEAYRFMGRPGQVFARDDIVCFRDFNPDNLMRGISRLEPLRSTLLNEDSARRSMAATWKNGTRPTGIVTSERELGTDGRSRLKKAFQSEHQGTGNHGRVILLEDGVTFEQMDAKAVDMAYLEARELNREEVCGVMDLPPSSLQIMDHATFSNITENMRSLYRDSMAPRIEFIESVIDWEVGREFNGPKVMKFAVAEVLRGAFEQRAESVAKLVQCGVLKPAEGRQMMDLNVAGPEADQLLVQGAMVPLTQAGQTPDTGNASGAGGVDGDQGPITHVPAIAGSGGTDVPIPVQKHVRDLKADMRRGHTLLAAAERAINRTGDRDGVREAFEYLLERQIA